MAGESRVDHYWCQFQRSDLGAAARDRRYLEAFFFGTQPELAHEISPLVLDGSKTATGSVLWSYQADAKPVPEVGDYSIVTNGGDDPVCVIETVEVRVLPYDEIAGAVGEGYARDGGEGDRTLATWRPMYWSYIVSECARIGREPSVQAPLVMERFRVVYSAGPER